jgi:uncharacterized protein (UPF0335 family)
MNDMTQPEADAHAEGVYRAVAGELRQFVERVERLNAEKADIAEQTKEVFAEAKARGYHPAVMRKVIARRKLEAAERAEMDAVTEMYEQALEGK